MKIVIIKVCSRVRNYKSELLIIAWEQNAWMFKKLKNFCCLDIYIKIWEPSLKNQILSLLKCFRLHRSALANLFDTRAAFKCQREPKSRIK